MTEDQLNKEAEDKYPDSKISKGDEFSYDYLNYQRREAFKAGYRSRDKEVEELEHWKKQQMEVWLPVLNFMQENAHDIKPGSRISKRVLEILKEYYKTRLRGDD